MTIEVKDRIKSNFTGKLFKVKLIKNGWAVLEQEGGPSQVLTDRANLNLFFERVGERRGGKRFIHIYIPQQGKNHGRRPRLKNFFQ